jgi:cell fate (sporulation/competence/biofilm development) regulator YlbF (YheA/YmcA/DUF963 family)
MKFEDFVKRGQAKKAVKDIQLAKSLASTTEQDLEFLKSLPINNISARKIISNYYDVLRSLLEAIASLDGYKIYSHEAFTYYLLEKGEEAIARKFERFRKVRNAINYYGREISVDAAKDSVNEIIELINKVKFMLEKSLGEG